AVPDRRRGRAPDDLRSDLRRTPARPRNRPGRPGTAGPIPAGTSGSDVGDLPGRIVDATIRVPYDGNRPVATRWRLSWGFLIGSSGPSTPRSTTALPRAGGASGANWPATSMPPAVEAIAEHVFVALADPTRRAILAALASGGPATATDLAGHLPITRQAVAKHLALLAEAGLVTAEPGERRRVRYRLRSAPMRVAQQFLAAVGGDWDRSTGALEQHCARTD